MFLLIGLFFLDFNSHFSREALGVAQLGFDVLWRGSLAEDLRDLERDEARSLITLFEQSFALLTL